MKKFISINQPQAIELGLNVKQAMLLSYLAERAQKRYQSEIRGDNWWHVVTYEEFLSDLPVVADKIDTVYRLLKQLESLNVIYLSFDFKGGCAYRFGEFKGVPNVT